MNRVNVLEIGPGNFGKGGLSVIVWSWYENFDHNNLKVDFVSPVNPDTEYIKYINNHDGRFFYVESTKNKVIRQFKKYFFIRNLLKSNTYDCVHIHVSNAIELYIYYLSCKSCGNKIIIHSHSTGIDCNSKKLAVIEKLLHNIFRHFVCNKNITRLACSDLAAEWMYPPKYNYTVINNGIETSKFIFNQQIRDKIRLELKIGNKFVVGHIGRFSYAKNHVFLIDTFNEVYKRNQNSVLLLVGTGELKKQIKDKVYGLGLDEVVIFYDSTPNVNEIYQAMDCFVFPSHFEGLGIVAIEAQATGLKTLCSDVVPGEAQITDLLEYMSLSESVEKWAEKILSYNNNYKRIDMSTEIKNAGYDIEQSAKQLEELYCECKMQS